jgi:LPS sulfotransferase NodH
MFRMPQRPYQSIFVCGVQRSGTWFLAHLLHRTGVVGLPNEWFHPGDVAQFMKDWGVSSYREYLARVFEAGTSANGVFASKLMWNYFAEFQFEVRRVTGNYGADDASLIGSVFPRPRFVWIRREDVVAQAVSWSKASQTGQYGPGQARKAEPVYNFDEIDALAALVRFHDGAWRRWFAAHGIEPFELTYENLCADPVGLTLEILAFTELEPSPGVTIAPLHERQADEVSAEWIARYSEERGSMDQATRLCASTVSMLTSG